MAPTYKKLTSRKATKVDGEVAEIKDLDQLLLIKKSFEDKLAEVNADITEIKALGIAEVAPVEPIAPVE